MGQVEGKSIIVTGGASGIGAACARVLAREGAKVLVTDIDAAQGEEVVADIIRKGGSAAFLKQDVADEKRWPEVVDEAVSRWKKLDGLVNNAGVGLAGSILDFSLEDWRRQMAINVEGVFLGTKYAVKTMKDTGGGSIVMMSSVAGFVGSPRLAGYCAAKGAVRLFTKAAAMECAQFDWNIRVNSVHPGIIDTPIWTKIPMGGQQFNQPAGANALDPNQLAQIGAPLKRAGKPEDIANAVLFLCSDASSYMTGTEMVIDGGILAR
ncbi:MAG: dehydrogenase [Alphaproteobacteria bacterium]|jgi:NAD(P)-dependent dehydrogenase (short-subunit alcohol dehydrogenase family)|nr:dehydrogenase [Alphaproteobacteria bacterium]